MSPRVRELTIQYRPHPSGAVLDRALLTPADSAALLVPILEHQAQEVAIVALLNTKYRLLGVHEISRGSLSSCEMSPQLIYRAALLVNATAVIIAHNHPSGDPTPSPDDLRITQQVKQAGQLFGIELVDHLIIGDRKYTSLKEQGIL